MRRPQRFFIAQVGKTHGLHGDLKLHLHTDFPEQFQVGYRFQSSAGVLEIQRINLKRGTVAFVGYEGVDAAKPLTNAKLYATIEETKARCHLQEGEHFWFEIEGCDVMEGQLRLGEVVQMQRLAEVNYMLIQTDLALVEEGLATTFLIPYIDRYVIETDVEKGIVLVRDAKEILEAS